VHSLDLKTDLSAFPGVSDVTTDSERERVVVSFVDDSKATVERDPLDLFARRESYIMSLSGQRQASHDLIFVGRPRDKVIEHLADLATRAAAAA
jgi:hypothetical protein